MKPQDVIVALALSSERPPRTYAELGHRCGLSTSEAHGAVGRLRGAGLVNHQRHVNAHRLLEFLQHGISFAFPVSPGGFTVGVPTGASRFVDEGVPQPEGGAWVWPSAGGHARGLAIEPLHKGVVERVADAKELWDLLALVDLVRAGRARERAWAQKMLERRLGGSRWPTAMPTVDPGRADALLEMFSHERLHHTVSRRLHERRRDLGGLPVARAVLAVHGQAIAAELHNLVPRGDFEPGRADVLDHRKPNGDLRKLTSPGLLDSLVATRIMDELEPEIRAGEDDRAFLARSRIRSLGTPGDYQTPWFRTWRAFLRSLDGAADEMAMALRTDIREFYGSVSHVLARQVLAQRTGAVPAVIEILFACIEAWNEDGVGGLPIDSDDVSALIAHAILRNVDDEFPDGPDLTYRRFVDDIVMYAPTTEDLESARARFEKTLQRHRLELNVRKTELDTADRVTGFFVDPFHDELREQASNVEQLTRWFSEFANHEPTRRALARRRHILSLAAYRSAPPLVLPAVGALREPGLRISALQFLATQALPAQALEAILGLEIVAWSELERVHLPDAVARAELEVASADDVAEWARYRADKSSSEAEQARLHLLAFKMDDSVPEHWRPMRSGSACTVAALFEAASPGRDIALSLQRHPWELLVRQLLTALQSGRFEPDSLRAVVLDVRRGSWRTEPEHLPLLHVLHGAVPQVVAPWLDRLLESRDEILRAHVGRLRQT